MKFAPSIDMVLYNIEYELYTTSISAVLGVQYFSPHDDDGEVRRDCCCCCCGCAARPCRSSRTAPSVSCSYYCWRAGCAAVCYRPLYGAMGSQHGRIRAGRRLGIASDGSGGAFMTGKYYGAVTFGSTTLNSGDDYQVYLAHVRVQGTLTGR